MSQNIDSYSMDVEEYDDDESVGVQVNTNNRKGKRKLTSKVWSYFSKLHKEGDQEAARYHCCQIVLKGGSKNGTTRLWRHLKENCEVYQKDSENHDGNSNVESFRFCQERSRRDLAEAIIVHEYPFSMVDHVVFKRFLKNLQPQFIVVSRQSIRNDCLHIYEILREKVLDQLRKLEFRSSITADFWTSLQNLRYLCITCHFIDHEWKLQKRIINFCKVDSRQTGEFIAKLIYTKLCAWNIDRKLFSMVLDNCYANDYAIRELKKVLVSNGYLPCKGNFFHMCCCAHILNIIVQDGLTCVQDVVHKIRESVKYVKASPLREREFKLYAEQLEAPKSSLILDVQTRWNSTYMMIDMALKFKNVFFILDSLDENYKYLPSNEEWENVRVVNEGLKMYYDMTKLFSGTKYTTSNVCFSVICELKLKLDHWCRIENTFVSSMAVKMLKKFDKYWKNSCMILAMAVVFDPRMKMKPLDCYFPENYGEVLGKSKIEKVKSSLVLLYNDYVSKSSANFGSLNSYFGEGSSSSVKHETPGGDDIDSLNFSWNSRVERLGKFLQETSSNLPMKNDLELYLEEPVLLCNQVFGDFDVLAWWKVNFQKYPIFGQVARDILAISVSTVASESAFSTGGRVIDQYRSSLTPKTVEALICAQDWLKSEYEALALEETEVLSSVFAPNLTPRADIEHDEP